MGYRQSALVGLDIGGSKIEGVLWKNGRVIAHRIVKTPRNKNSFFRAIGVLVSGFTETMPVQGIGVAIAGAIDYQKGRIFKSPNLSYLDGQNFKKTLSRQFKIPIRMDNDTNCFLRGEGQFGQARGKRNVVALTLGTGVGGAVLVSGQMLQGRHGAAGELGHMIVSAKRGRFLNLEDLVSSHGFRRLGVRDPLVLQKQALAGKPEARAVYKQVGKYLGIGLANLANIFDPELILLGGGIAKARALLLRSALEEMRKHAMLPAAKLPPVRVTKLEFPGALGALSLFF